MKDSDLQFLTSLGIETAPRTARSWLCFRGIGRAFLIRLNDDGLVLDPDFFGKPTPEENRVRYAANRVNRETIQLSGAIERTEKKLELMKCRLKELKSLSD